MTANVDGGATTLTYSRHIPAHALYDDSDGHCALATPLAKPGIAQKAKPSSARRRMKQSRIVFLYME